MYWAASAIHVVFCKSVTWPWMTHVNGCANQMMLYGCRNQKHMLLWSRLEDVVQMLRRMYSFWFYVFSRQQPTHLWMTLRSETKKCDTGCSDPSAFFLVKVRTATDTMTHNTFCSTIVLGIKRFSHIKMAHLPYGIRPAVQVLLFTFMISKSSLYIFLQGNEPLTF